MLTSQNNSDENPVLYFTFLVSQWGDAALLCQYIGEGLAVPFDPWENDLWCLQVFADGEGPLPRSICSVFYPSEEEPNRIVEIFNHYVTLNLTIDQDDGDLSEGNPPVDPTMN